MCIGTIRKGTTYTRLHPRVVGSLYGRLAIAFQIFICETLHKLVNSVDVDSIA